MESRNGNAETLFWVRGLDFRFGGLGFRGLGFQRILVWDQG